MNVVTSGPNDLENRHSLVRNLPYQEQIYINKTKKVNLKHSRNPLSKFGKGNPDSGPLRYSVTMNGKAYPAIVDEQASLNFMSYREASAAKLQLITGPPFQATEIELSNGKNKNLWYTVALVRVQIELFKNSQRLHFKQDIHVLPMTPANQIPQGAGLQGYKLKGLRAWLGHKQLQAMPNAGAGISLIKADTDNEQKDDNCKLVVQLGSGRKIQPSSGREGKKIRFSPDGPRESAGSHRPIRRN